MTMVHVATVTLLVFPSFAVATPLDGVFSKFATRQASVSLPNDCNTTCMVSEDLISGCDGKGESCQCNAQFFQSFADCILCEHDPSDPENTPQGLAEWKLSLEIGSIECLDAGFPVDFTFQLPPDAQAIVDEAHRQDNHLRQRQTTFLALQIAGGHVGLVIVLAVALFSRQVHRNPTFFNFCFTCIISSIFYSVLLYRGTAGNSVEVPLRNVPFHTCLAQAALVNGAQVMTASATMALVIQLWISLRVAIYGDSVFGWRYQQWMTLLLLVLPYILFFSFAMPSIVLGRVQIFFADSFVPRALPTTFYCSIVDLDSFARAIYGMTLGLLTVTAVFDLLIVLLLYRHWKAFRKTKTKNPVALSTFIRTILFSLYRIAVAITYGTVFGRPPIPEAKAEVIDSTGAPDVSFASGVPIWVDMLQAAVPLVAFLVLGLSSHMFITLTFRRKTVRHSELRVDENVKPVAPS